MRKRIGKNFLALVLSVAMIAGTALTALADENGADMTEQYQDGFENPEYSEEINANEEGDLENVEESSSSDIVSDENKVNENTVESSAEAAVEEENPEAENSSTEDSDTGKEKEQPEDTEGEDKKEEEVFSFESTGLPVLNLTIGNGITLDTVNAGSKNVKYSDSTVDLYTDGDPEAEPDSYTGVEFKGRGNSSWIANKKSYQIKFSKKTSFFGMKKAKKYVLIANYCDDALIRNAMTYDIGKNLGLAWTDYQFIDFYVNDEYVGNYMICQKPEVGSNSLNLKNDDGVLMEVDLHESAVADEDDYYVQSSYSGAMVTLKDSVSSDENIYKAAVDDFMESFEALEKAADEKDWETVQSLIDVESFVKYYLLSEWTANPDAQKSSCYIYKDGAGDVLHFGPIWDFDRAYNNYSGYSYYNSSNVAWLYLDDYAQTSSSYPYENKYPQYQLITKLIHIPEFRTIACETWETVKNAASGFMENEYDALVSSVRTSALKNHEIWLRSDFDTAVDNLKSFITERTSFMDVWYGETVDIDEGDYNIVTSDDSKLYADETGTISKKTDSKANIIWNINKESNGYYSICNRYTDGYLGQVQGESKLTDLGLSALAFSETTDDYVNLWSFIDAGDGKIYLMNMATLNFLEIGDDGKSISCSYAKASENQAFKLVPVESDSRINTVVGTNRYETAAKLASLSAGNSYPDTIILATGSNFADALCANGIAGAMRNKEGKDVPLLLSSVASLSDSVKKLLTDTWHGSVTSCVIIGYTMSNQVIKDLTNSGIDDVTIIGGNNRYETSAAVCRWGIRKGYFDTDAVIFAKGTTAADTLSMSSWSYYYGMPTLLTNGTEIKTSIKTLLKKYDTVYDVGKAGSSNNLSDCTKNGSENVVELNGKNRFETSEKIAEYFMSKDEFTTYRRVSVVYGKDLYFPDGLAAGQWSARTASPVILVRDNNEVFSTYLKNLLSENDNANLYAIGSAGKNKIFSQA